MEDYLQYYDCVGDNESSGEQFNFDCHGDENHPWHHMVFKVTYEVYGVYVLQGHVGFRFRFCSVFVLKFCFN